MKDILTNGELMFLASQRLSPEDVFDARGMSQDVWKQRAKETGKTLALGNGCRNGGHRLKTRGGHCVQCDPKKLAYQKRFSAEQYVYIAGSLTARLVKIGTCEHCGQRIDQIRREKYGSAADWELLYRVTVRNAGEIEHAARARLSRYIVVRPYWKDGSRQDATELLRCSFSQALEALEEVAANAKVEEPWKRRFTFSYEFDESEKP